MLVSIFMEGKAFCIERLCPTGQNMAVPKQLHRHQCPDPGVCGKLL